MDNRSARLAPLSHEPTGVVTPEIYERVIRELNEGGMVPAAGLYGKEQQNPSANSRRHGKIGGVAIGSYSSSSEK